MEPIKAQCTRCGNEVGENLICDCLIGQPAPICEKCGCDVAIIMNGGRVCGCPPTRKDEYFVRKHDSEKVRWDLIDLKTVGVIASVLTYGAKKYAPDSWQTIPDGEKRYFGALMRHLEAYQSGEILDDESGLPHIHHALCNLYFLTWFQSKGGKIK